MSTWSRRYPDIEDYGIIGDSRALALVSRDGSIDWLCLPHFDSPSIFGRLLDWDRGGYFQIAPDVEYTVRRRYIDATNVLETTFHTASGEVSLIDFMPAQTEGVKRRTLAPLRTVIRLVEGRGGRVPMRLSYVPRPDYGVGGVNLVSHSPHEVTASRGRHVMHLRSDVPLDATRYDARARFDAVPGTRLRLSLAYSFAEPAVIISDGYVDEVYDQTLDFWRGWSAQCKYDGPYHNEVHRSALALKLHAYAPSGAIIAAATTSLPEEVGGTRNWDYRYCWLRDAAFTVKSLLSIGLEAEANAFVSWLMHATHQTAPRLEPLYTLFGEPHVPERALEHLEGYRGSQPVRVGNAASAQAQFDVYGELIDAFHALIEDQRKPVSRDEAAFLRSVADYVARNWRQADNGIWEARAEKQQYTHSKVMAWDALQHAAMLVDDGLIRGDAARWRAEAAEIRRWVLEHGYNREIGAFTQTLDGRQLDAAVLAMPLVGFIDARDPRMLSTIDVIRQRLNHDGFLRRYTEFDDGLPGQEGAFLVCNFWLAAALATAARSDDARAVFERTLTAQNDLGLLSEEYDTETKKARGNFPQGLSHLALIAAALAIEKSECAAGEERKHWPSPSPK